MRVNLQSGPQVVEVMIVVYPVLIESHRGIG
jgi:hypothetical protein